MSGTVRVALVEDNASDRESIRRNLLRYEREGEVRFCIEEFQDGDELVDSYAGDFDLILLDVLMAHMDGMRAARRVRELDGDVVILFITGSPQFAIEGYKVDAADYILKPVSWFSFCDSMARALKRVKSREKSYITVALKGGHTRLALENICYVEVQDHVLIYNTTEGKLTAKGTMRDAESQLSGGQFFRCNRCYLVNLKYVETFVGCDAVVHGDTIQVSRSRRKGFMDALNLYLNGDWK